MPRWGPDADDRLYRAAMELIFERGYEEVTVAEIAERAGLKKRSFFRHFADKREVLFAGSADFDQTVVDALGRTPATATPVEAVLSALAEAGAALASWGEPVRQRQRIIAASTELRERELMKLDRLATAVAGALRPRGLDDFSAALVAHVGVAAFRTAFGQWAEAAEPRDFSAIMEEALGCLRAAVGSVDPAGHAVVRRP